MQRRNNLLAVSGFILVAFLALIPTDWFSVASLGVSNNALIGSLGFPGTPKIPIWLLLSVSASAIAVIALNLLRITSIPQFIPALGLLLGGVYYALPLSIAEDHFTVRFSAAPYLALALTLAGVGLAFVPSIYRSRSAPRRTESGEEIPSAPHA